MKRICCLALCLLLFAGCAAKPAQTQSEDLTPVQDEPSAQTQTPATEQPQASPPSEPAAQDVPPDGAPLNEGEPEGWEEEWPEEYVVDGYRLEDGAITQTGELKKYRFAQLDGAERYMDIIALYVQQFLGDSLAMEEDSPHNGYANWFYSGEHGTASVSGSSITGRFCYMLSLDFDKILENTESAVMDEAAMERAARDFCALFRDITGKLELLKAEKQEADYNDPRSDEPRAVSVPVMVYTFRSAENSSLTLDMQDGQPAPVCCGDSTIEDLKTHCFTATVWPDGTVVEANNYITRSEVTENGTARMLTQDDLPRLLNFFTSTTAQDTVVFESIRADRFDVYFGSADIEPVLTVEYHFESDPEAHYSTQFVLPGLLDPV